MSKLLNIFASYLKKNIIVIITGTISLCIFLVIFMLYNIPIEPIVYAAILVIFFVTIIFIINFVYFYRRHTILNKLKNNITIAEYKFPSTINLIEKDYQELIKEIDSSRKKINNEGNKFYSDLVEYYTLWVHQIKTPISAMSLILQFEKTETNKELLEQLFIIEQYVEMVLQYLRLEELNSDLILKKYSLDDIVKQAIKKYARIFIRKKIKLNYIDLNCSVLTDEKWLVFVVEQLLSNSLKYTLSGEISIYIDEILPETLVIEDTGIGIEQEDLPRVFEKGFTGYNGRLDKKSTGIGLYLCKQILNKLSHTIEIESEIGKGTKVKIGLKTMEIDFE
ncbi:MAG: sensor histidine kinase [Tissierellia bacterium]|nr:sensor histidine kinase [Tissierellia bacterium]MDD4781047.1 sensor histidine kinase [Tissierellia bacterium]